MDAILEIKIIPGRSLCSMKQKFRKLPPSPPSSPPLMSQHQPIITILLYTMHYRQGLSETKYKNRNFQRMVQLRTAGTDELIDEVGSNRDIH